MEFERHFIISGLDPNDPLFCRWVPEKLHSEWHGKLEGRYNGGRFNEEWRGFFIDINKMDIVRTDEEILAQLGKMREDSPLP